MYDYNTDRLVRFRVESIIARVTVIEMCSNGRVVGHFSCDNTSPVTCASEVEVALDQAHDVFLKLQQLVLSGVPTRRC